MGDVSVQFRDSDPTFKKPINESKMSDPTEITNSAVYTS